jgi:hypothetical protein
MVEAHIGGGYERGLDTAVKLTQLLNQQMDKPVRLTGPGVFQALENLLVTPIGRSG